MTAGDLSDLVKTGKMLMGGCAGVVVASPCGAAAASHLSGSHGCQA